MAPRRASRIVLGGLLLAVSCARAVGPFHATSAQRAAVRTELEAMLGRAAANWNRGDLDAFMGDYLPSDSTTYIGGRGLVRGPSRIRASYARLFTGAIVRDSLSFAILDVDPVAPDVANLIAEYILARRVVGRDSVTARGPTSLLVRRVDGRWRIVHDHSS
ncbi:MAG: YybH family protein [Gemmatimonadaceae bacterium]